MVMKIYLKNENSMRRDF